MACMFKCLLRVCVLLCTSFIAGLPTQTPAEVLSVMRNEEEIHSGYSGDNIKLKLQGVEEEGMM